MQEEGFRLVDRAARERAEVTMSIYETETEPRSAAELLVSPFSVPEVEANVEPLHSLGVTGWSEDGTSHGLLRLTTD